ncbi:MAG: hypothetical protein RSB67_03965 [Clostridia bacterium]
MNDSAIKAIMIGAGTLIAIITISLVLNYYNTARQTVQNIGTGPDIAYNYREDIKTILLRANGKTDQNKPTIKGVDVKNMLNYFYDNKEFKINVSLNYSLTQSNKINYKRDNVNNNKEEYNIIVNQLILDQEFTIERTTITEEGLEKTNINLVGQ